jgi:hypothetical protein
MVTDNKFDFYNITDIADKNYKILDRKLERIIVKMSFHNTSIVTLFDNRFRKDITKKYKLKLVVITGDFLFSDPQISKRTSTGYILNN